MGKKLEIRFASEDKVDKLSHVVIKAIYGIEGAFISNESAFEDFEDIDYPGHKLISYKKVPEKDKKYYNTEVEKSKLTDPDRYMVWYPPISEKDSKKFSNNLRKNIERKIKKVFGISLSEYPKDEPIYIWKVAEIILKRERES